MLSMAKELEDSCEALDMITSNVTIVDMGWLKFSFKEFLIESRPSGVKEVVQV